MELEPETQPVGSEDLRRHDERLRQVRPRTEEPTVDAGARASGDRQPPPAAPALAPSAATPADLAAACRAALGPKLPAPLYKKCQAEAEDLASRMRTLLKLRRAAAKLEEEIALLSAGQLTKGMRPSTLAYVVAEHAQQVSAELRDHTLSFVGCSYEAAFAKLHVFSNLTFRALTLEVLKAQVVEVRPLLTFEGCVGRCENFVESFYDPIEALQNDLGVLIPRPPPLVATLPAATAELLYSTVCKTIASENEKEQLRVSSLAAARQKNVG
jgi:hypothetical protein